MQQVAGCFSDDAIQEHVALVHQGDCPLCHGPGPVDVHVSHRVWSGPKVIRLSDRRLVCCRSCAVKARLRDTAFSLWRGWRGIPRVPWLPLLQALRNLGGLLSLPHPAYPSDALVRLVRTNLASEFLLERNRENMSQLPAIRA